MVIASRPGSHPISAFHLIALTFKCASVATSSVFDVRTRLSALIGLQQMTLAISAAIRVARINRRASREQRDSLCGAAVVPQRAKQRVGVVQVSGVGKGARAVTAQVVAMRGDDAATISTRIVRENAVLQRRCAAVKDTASRVISANGAVIHCQVPRTIDDGATRSAAHSGTAVSDIRGDGAVVQRHCAADGVECTANTDRARDAGAARGIGDIAGESTVFNHQQRAPVVDAAAKSRASCVAVSPGLIPADDAVADDQRARIVDTPTPRRAAPDFAEHKKVDTWDGCQIPTDGAVG